MSPRQLSDALSQGNMRMVAFEQLLKGRKGMLLVTIVGVIGLNLEDCLVDRETHRTTLPGAL